MKLEIKNVTKTFDHTDIIKDVSVEFTDGKIYGIVGRNGSGKSVLLKLICGFYTPSSGDILLDGDNYIKRNGFPPETRALIEKPNFLPDLTGYDNLELLASIQNKIGKQEIEETLEKLNLTSEANKKYKKYSLGTKQKLGIAQVLMEDPKLIILDEPFNGIESDTAKQVRDILQQEKENGKIIIVASHISEDIENMADVVYKVENGKLILL